MKSGFVVVVVASIASFAPVLACATPHVGTASDDARAGATKGAGDDEATGSEAERDDGSGATSAKPGSASSGGATTSGGSAASDATSACTACFEANPKSAAAVKCLGSCATGKACEACFDACDGPCLERIQACNASARCKAEAEAVRKACDTCLAPNKDARNVAECQRTTTDPTAFNACEEKCDGACQEQLEACKRECS